MTAGSLCGRKQTKRVSYEVFASWLTLFVLGSIVTHKVVDGDIAAALRGGRRCPVFFRCDVCGVLPQCAAGGDAGEDRTRGGGIPVGGGSAVQ